jgi:hypothetical protein
MLTIEPKQRLTRLVELAGQQGPAARRALVGELSDLLLDWPETYPAEMREPFEALLERAIREIDADARQLLAERLAHANVLPVSILNGLLFDAAPAARTTIVSRNAMATDGPVRIGVNEATLLPAARSATEAELAKVVAARFRIPDELGIRIVRDASAYFLAVLCIGARVSRATFSALALTAAPHASTEDSYRRLATYDDVPNDGARGLLAFWRSLAAPAASRAA